MSGRSPVPLSITDPEQQIFLDRLWKRKVAAITPLGASPTTAQIATAFNALLAAMQDSGAMDQG
jgi:hypothetical protein